MRFISNFKLNLFISNSQRGNYAIFSRFFSTVNGLQVLKYPNPKLRQSNDLIDKIDDDLKAIVEEMFLLMYKSKGAGLAAPQVGINKRLMVFNSVCSNKPEHGQAMLNPIIVLKSDATLIVEEGCISFTAVKGKVVRHKWVEIEYLSLSGEQRRCKLEGDAALVFQHEYDHLDQVLLVDHLSTQDLAENSREIKRLIKNHGPGGAL